MIKKIHEFIIKNSGDCLVTEFASGLAIRAVSQDEFDLQRFQPIARTIIDGAGENYSIPVKPHFCSSYSADYCDVVVIEWSD